MNGFEQLYGSVVIPDDERETCAALPDEELKEAARGASDQSITYAARQEIGSRIIPRLVARHIEDLSNQ